MKRRGSVFREVKWWCPFYSDRKDWRPCLQVGEASSKLPSSVFFPLSLSFSLFVVVADACYCQSFLGLLALMVHSNRWQQAFPLSLEPDILLMLLLKLQLGSPPIFNGGHYTLLSSLLFQSPKPEQGSSIFLFFPHLPQHQREQSILLSSSAKSRQTSRELSSCVVAYINLLKNAHIYT